jgi:hypothetical protein
MANRSLSGPRRLQTSGGRFKTPTAGPDASDTPLQSAKIRTVSVDDFKSPRSRFSRCEECEPATFRFSGGFGREPIPFVLFRALRTGRIGPLRADVPKVWPDGSVAQRDAGETFGQIARGDAKGVVRPIRPDSRISVKNPAEDLQTPAARRPTYPMRQTSQKRLKSSLAHYIRNTRTCGRSQHWNSPPLRTCAPLLRAIGETQLPHERFEHARFEEA